MNTKQIKLTSQFWHTSKLQSTLASFLPMIDQLKITALTKESKEAVYEIIRTDLPFTREEFSDLMIRCKLKHVELP